MLQHRYPDWKTRILTFFERIISLASRFVSNMVSAIEDYLRSKTRQMPSILPKGRRAIVEAILDKAHHQDFLARHSRESGIPLDQIKKTFRGYLLEIAADLNYLSFPFWDALLTWVFETIYEGLEVDSVSLEKIRPLMGKTPIVFVSNHRSHMDYLLLSYIFYYHQISMPHVCAGANLSFWPLGSIFRKSGGFFIRRSYEGNKLYAAAVQAYMEELLREKVNLEFFIEGGRSRTGKLLPPKMGILSAITQAYSHGAAKDILLVPTSVTYESILEEKSYADENAGGAKKEETFWDLFKLRQYLKKRKGKVYIEFGETISVKEFLNGTEAASDQAREKTRQLAYELTYGINKSSVVTPSSLVATALLTHPGRSLSEKKLSEKVDGYLEYVRHKECRLSEPLQKYLRSAVRESLNHYVRDHLIEQYEDDDGSPLYTIKEDRRSLLDYYKNTSLHFFVSIAVLATLLKSCREDMVSFSKIEEGYIFFQDLFRYEFTFSRRQSLHSHIEKLIDYLAKKEWVTLDGPQIKISSEARPKLGLFSSPIKNFLESYYILWKILPQLHQRRWEVKELLKGLHQKGHVLYIKEEISCCESVNKFTFQNALWAFRDLGILLEEKDGWGKKRKIYYKVHHLGASIGQKLTEFLGKS